MTIRIALIRQEQTGSDGGAQAIIDLMLQALEQADNTQLSLLCRKWDTVSNDNKMSQTKKVILDPSYSNRKNKQLSFNRAVKNYIQQHPFDIIQSHERLEGCHIFRAGDGVHKVWLEQKASISNVLQRWWQARSPYHKALLAEEKNMFESSSLKKVICNSEMVKQEILTHFTIPEHKIAVIYNGVDTQRFKPANPDIKSTIRASLNIPHNARVFIFPGSGFERKNLASTINAFSQIDERCYLLVVGRDKKQQHYMNLAKKHRCQSRIRFLGAQDREKMPMLYQAADVVVLPTLYDPFPNVILEGLASGLPCITSTRCGAVDIIPDAGCGHIIQATDEKALVGAMTHYLDASILRHESTIAATVAKSFTKEAMQKKLLALYSELLEKNNYV